MEERETFTTKIDNCGRFVIPTRLIKSLGWEKGIIAIGEKIDDTIVIRSLGKQMHCHKCNKLYSSQFNFCPTCGNKLEEKE